RPLGGVVRFSAPGLGIAGVGESRLLDAFMTPIVRDRAAGISTGIAAINTGSDGVLKATLRNLLGITIRERQIPIPGNGHVARFVHELFPDLGDFQGTLTVVGSPVAATAIQVGSQPGQFTTLPVISVSPQPVAEPQYFAQFGNGAGLVSSLFLTNPSASTRARGELVFSNDDGVSLLLSLNGLPAASRVAFDIAPGGGAVFTTDGLGPAVIGSAQAMLTEGVIGGVLRFSLPGAGIAGVGAGVPTTGFITPVSRNAATGLNTGVAVSSTGQAVRLTLTLRNAGGQPIPNGTANLELQPGGHRARLIDELFPNAETGNLQGTLTVTAEGGTIVATAIQLGAQAGQFTTLPVTRLQ
ncbi:MAG: hypothetical protein HY644_10920, partial [Acidobacteria bacterium]|nr:hypothetical protein [Acidobacteriota bacterium]